MSKVVVVLVSISLLVGCGSRAGQAGDPPSGALAAGYNPTDGQAGLGYPVRIDDDTEKPDATETVVAVLMSPFTFVGDVVQMPVSAVKAAGGDNAGHAARMTLDKSSPDHRREGVYKLVDYPFAQHPPYTTHYEQMAQTDTDPTVRAAAIRACNRARDYKATPVFIVALSDKSDLVKLEGAKGLANMPDPNATPSLLKLAGDPDADRDVRIAAIDALKYYRTLPVGRALSALVADRDFSIAWQARRSLVYLTHRDFGYDQGAWLGFLAGPEKPLG